MSLTTWFGWSVSDKVSDELPAIFPIAITKENFVRIDVEHIYSKILTDVVERTSGLNDDQVQLLWDNCLMSNNREGLITMLSKAMAQKKELFLVYEKALKVVRIATGEEQAQIKADYAKSAESKIGLYVSFKNLTKSDMVALYSALDFSNVASLNKTMNLASAIQFKMNDLRAGVGLTDSTEVKSQAKSIATALGKGLDVLTDAKDIIETMKPDLTAIKESIELVDSKRSWYLGLPKSYISGDQTSGLNADGQADQKAVERGLKAYYFSVIKPVLEALFTTKLTYKSQDFRQIDQALNAMKTFDLTSADYLTWENKKKVVEGLLDIEASENQIDEPPPPEPMAPTDPNQKPGAPVPRGTDPKKEANA